MVSADRFAAGARIPIKGHTKLCIGYLTGLLLDLLFGLTQSKEYVTITFGI